MTRHHTKDKGDLGVAKAHANLVAQGYMVLFPTTEHAPFDLVAYDGTAFHRVQVKYRSGKSGRVQVRFRSYWADKDGSHRKPVDKAQIDLICIYCPETDQCYYVRPQEFRETVTLRTVPARNGQRHGILDATQFLVVPVTPAVQAEGLRSPTGMANAATR